MKLLGVPIVVAYLCELASALSASGIIQKESARSSIVPVQQHDDTFRSDTTLRFMRRKRAKEEPEKEPAKLGPVEDVGNALEEADKGDSDLEARFGDMMDGKFPKIPKAENPIEAAGKAIEKADEDAAKAIAGKETAEKKPAEQKPAEVKTEEPKPKIVNEPEDKEVPSVPGCKNAQKGWKDKKGHDCEDYAEGEWCDRNGRYGDGWLDEWGNFEDVATNGKSAPEVCCVCGGGVRKGGAFQGPAGAPVSGDEAAPSPAAPPSPAGPLLGSMKYRPLQEQGFHGEDVIHVDQETMTGDWGREFGPAAGHRDVRKICKEHPGNEWCLLHGYYDKKKKSHQQD
jgi:hypothetical protein